MSYSPISHCRIKDLLGFEVDELVGKSVYNYHHALDSEGVEKAYKTCKYWLFVSFCIDPMVTVLVGVC